MKERRSSSGEYVVHREVFNEPRLDEVAQKGMWSTKPTVGEQIKESLRCSVPRLKHTVLTWIPVLSWLPHYSIRENALGDLISGCSVGIMHLPQGMAYALLASLRPVLGLYTSFYPVLVYFIFGTSKHISVGTFAVISIMIGSVTERLAPDSNFIINGTNGTEDLNIAMRDSMRVQIACSLTVLAGIFQILLGVVKFGFVVTYLSEPLVRGYTTASACHVCVSQLKYLFGVKPARFAGPFAFIYTLVDVCRQLPQMKVPELVVSLVALAVLIVVKEINACYRQKLPLPIPIELIVIIAATLITHFCGLPETYGVNVVGEIPSGLKAPRAPDPTFFSQIIGDAFAVAIVGYAVNISLGKTFALKHGYKVDSNQELVAAGLCNAIGGCFQCYAVTSSLSRSLVQESTGGKTQVAGVVSSVIVLITILKIGSLFEDLPKAVLATIVFVNLKGMFKQFMDVPFLWKTNRVDLLVWLVTFISTVLLNLDLGLAVSVGFSVLTVIFRTQLPRYSILGNVPGTDLYLDTEKYRAAQEIPGIKIIRSSATINYTNAELYLEFLQEKSGIEIEKLQAERKKQKAKQKCEQEKEKTKNRKDAKMKKKDMSHHSNTTNSVKDLQPSERNVFTVNMDERNQNHVALKPMDSTINSFSKGKINRAYQTDSNMSDSDSDTCDPSYEDITEISHQGGGGERASGSDIHNVILDMSTTSSVDTVTVKMLKNIFRDFRAVDLNVYLAGCQACVVEQLEMANFFSESVPKSRLFVSVHDAVLYIRIRLGQSDFTTCLFYSSPLVAVASSPFNGGEMRHFDMAAGCHGNTRELLPRQQAFYGMV
ncbi:solute carrier family 26 member 6 [Nematolebias whitei]|uniref:solute carrier family 26 member 6 n=1 Tax=Nematolebias whitei TaxID=451745 RepID=UPI001899AE63|nr:solute carrier family 26 member 6 [Nematolebias whitei]